jgi:catechol 1,2-dioxygenase
MNSPRTENGGSIVRSPTPGPELFASCRIVDPHGAPLAGVEVDVWQSSPVGLYENQDEAQTGMNLRGKFTTDAEGRFSFRSVKPGPYPVPTDGPVGELLRAQERHPYRPAHLHFLGFKTLITQVFVDDDCYLDSDVVFGVTRALIGDYHPGSGTAPASNVKGLWFTFAYAFVMEPGDAVLPNPPIK